MHLVHLTPGTGTFHCGSCLRDHALIKGLRALGHDAHIVPLYLPMVTDGDEADADQPVRVGGISLYLQEKLPWFHRLPAFVHRWLNAPGLLRKASLRMGMTSAKDLGVMTVGSLAGEKGRQWAEWRKLIDWLKQQPKIDVVSLSNSMLTGLAKAIKEETGARVVVSLQGEDAFLDTLIQPYRDQAWQALRENARHVERFISPSRYYAGLMGARMAVGGEKMAVVMNGIDASPIPIAKPDAAVPTIGYFARMIHGKGLTVLVDAFIELIGRDRVPNLRLKIGGAVTPADEGYIAGLKKRLAEAGCQGRVEWLPNVDLEGKARFFSDLTVFTVPAVYGEAFGLYVPEAMAAGVPVVQPESGAFPEILAATGGGLLCKHDDAISLADGLQRLLEDPALRDELGRRGMARVREDFTHAAMAARFDEVLRGVA